MDSTSPAPARRTPRAEVRRRLLEAAAEVFTEKGYVDSRLDDIAATAGFTKGAIYSNFGNKQGLFGAVLAERAGAERDRLLGELGADPADLAGTAARIIAEEITTDPGRGQLGLEFAARAVRDQTTREVWTPLRRAQREAAEQAIGGLLAHRGAVPGIPPRVMALILHCLTIGLSSEHLADPEHVDRAAIDEAIATVVGALLHPHDPQSLREKQR